MTDKDKLTAARLRIVASNGKTVTKPPEHRTLRRRQHRKIKDAWFSPIPLWWLNDARFHKLYPARARVHTRLWFETHGGTESVAVTNELAAQLGLPKQGKMRELRWLEREGFLTVEAIGNRTPIIRLLPLSHQPE